MIRPEMILFDYGHTLVNEKMEGCLKGIEAVMQYAVENRSGVPTSEIARLADKLFYMAGEARAAHMEISQQTMNHYIYTYFGIKLSLSPEETELVFWDHFSPGESMPGTAAMLDKLDRGGIRTGVISNISFSSAALKRRIDQLLPDNCFEFIIASADYMLRKPNAMLFELALRKADLPAEAVWYCGDNLYFDVQGSHEAGLYPIRYESILENPHQSRLRAEEPNFPYHHICDWSELTDLLGL